MKTVVGLCLVLAASTAATAAVERQSPHWSHLKGKGALPSGATIPASALLHVRLQDLSPGVPRDASVAKTTTSAGRKNPVPIDLKYDRSLLDPGRPYGVSAWITDASGVTLWETPVPIRVLTLGNAQKAQLSLRRVETRRAASAKETLVNVDCGEARFDARVTDEAVTLLLPGGAILLKRDPAASGASYSDSGTLLNLGQDSAYYERAGKAYRDCKVTRR